MKPPRWRLWPLLVLVMMSLLSTVEAAQNSAKNEARGKSGRHERFRSFEANPLPGSRAIVSILAEGTIVKPGDLVCELDSSALRDSLENLRIKIESAQAELKNQSLSIEVAELAVKEVEATIEQDKATLADSARLVKAEAELIELRIEGSEAPSPSDSRSLKESKRKLQELESQLANQISSPERLGTLRQTVEASRAEQRACHARLDGLRSEGRGLEARIALCRMTAKIDGRVVLARWRPDPSSPEGYAVLEPNALVVESQPIFRISPRMGKVPRPSGGTMRREGPRGLPSSRTQGGAGAIPKG